MNSPCNGCTYRQFRCHGVCAKYKEFAEFMKKIGDAQKKESEVTLTHHFNMLNATKQRTHGVNKTGRIKK